MTRHRQRDEVRLDNDCLNDTVSVLGLNLGYTVKYTPSPEGVPEGKVSGNSFRVYLTVYPKLSANTDTGLIRLEDVPNFA